LNGTESGVFPSFNGQAPVFVACGCHHDKPPRRHAHPTEGFRLVYFGMISAPCLAFSALVEPE